MLRLNVIASPERACVQTRVTDGAARMENFNLLALRTACRFDDYDKTKRGQTKVAYVSAWL